MKTKEKKLLLKQTMICVRKGQKNPGYCQPLLSSVRNVIFNKLQSNIPEVKKLKAVMAAKGLMNIALNPQKVNKSKINRYVNDIARAIEVKK